MKRRDYVVDIAVLILMIAGGAIGYFKGGSHGAFIGAAAVFWFMVSIIFIHAFFKS